MSTIARRVAEELHAFADIRITDDDVEHALRAVHDRVNVRAGRRQRSLVPVAAATALTAVILGVTAWLALDGPETALPAEAPLPADGTLVIEFWSHPLWGHDGMVWVYADGRVITSENERPSYAERRLTARGLRILRDEVSRLSGSVTADELRHPCVPVSCVATKPAVIEVDGVHHEVADNDEMAHLLFEMESNLPASAWSQRRPTPYVPSAYDGCYGPAHYGREDQQVKAIEQSLLLGSLPVEVRDLLAAKPTLRLSANVDLPTDLRCSRLTPSEAQLVAGPLDLPLGINNTFHEFESMDGQGAHIFLSVVLPDGASGLYGG